MKNSKTIAKCVLALMLVLLTTVVVEAYNAKFSFDLSSGMFRSWAYSSTATKFTVDQAPVVKCIYTDGSTSKFEYTVVNSNNEARVTNMTKTGTFPTTAFTRNITQQNYQYRLGVRRVAGAWHSTARTEGNWNIDSY